MSTFYTRCPGRRIRFWREAERTEKEGGPLKARRGKIFRVAAPWLLTILAVQGLMWAVLGWSPLLGNLVSMIQLRAYTAQVYPDLVPQGHWAWYNPEDNQYYRAFTLKGGGGRRALGYELKSGLVDDERRETVLRMDLGIAKSPQAHGYQAFWRARWKPWSPEEPVVDIRIYSHEAQEDRHGGYLWHAITVELPEDEPLTREMVLAGKLVTS